MQEFRSNLLFGTVLGASVNMLYCCNGQQPKNPTAFCNAALKEVPSVGKIHRELGSKASSCPICGKLAGFWEAAQIPGPLRQGQPLLFSYSVQHGRVF